MRHFRVFCLTLLVLAGWHGVNDCYCAPAGSPQGVAVGVVAPGKAVAPGKVASRQKG
jgi:hypothetical protein